MLSKEVTENPNENGVEDLTNEQSLGTDLLPEAAKIVEDTHSAIGDVLAKSSAEVETTDLKLKTQFQNRFESLQHYGFLNGLGEPKEGDVRPPSFERVMSIFSPKELEAAKGFHKPILLLIPESSFDAKVKALDENKGYMQRNTYVDEAYEKTDEGSGKITGWRAVIADGGYREIDRHPEAKDVNRHIYAMLMMESLKNKKPIDKISRTELAGDSAYSDSKRLYADFYPGGNQVFFGSFASSDNHEKARRRYYVGGDKILT